MRISTRSRYGLKVMYELALKYGGDPVFLKEIARTHHISEKYLSKLVIPLRGVGLILSHRGAHGGYTLARAPRDVTVMDIVRVLEGDFSPASRTRRSRSVDGTDFQPTEEVWVTMEKAINQTLGAITLESLVQAGRSQILNDQI
jgi:Rrf2 family transcriptional regulator, cysteine metabolism repressor